MSYSFWRPQPWRPGALAPLLLPSYATATYRSKGGRPKPWDTFPPEQKCWSRMELMCVCIR